MALEYIREYHTYFHIGQSYGVSESNCFKIIKRVEDTLIKHPGFALPRKKEVLKDNIECEILVIDGTEALIESPKKTEKFYSGKKEKHTIKTQVVIAKGSRKIICTFFANGKRHDFRIFKESKVRMLSITKVLVDSGYRSMQKFRKNVQLPHRRSKRCPLQKDKKAGNKVLSSQRAIVENVIGLLKQFKVISDRYRNRQNFSLRFNLIAAIHNFELPNEFERSLLPKPHSKEKLYRAQTIWLTRVTMFGGATMSDYLSLLNSEQQLAVTSVDGPVLILAGAGTGKTRTITSRIAHIIRNSYAHSDEILAVTFTNKAANEMVSRVLELTGTNIPWLGTFHAVAARILRQHAEIIGLKSNFTIISVDDQLHVIKNIINDINPNSLSEKHKTIMNIIQRWKEKCLLPSEVKETQLFRPVYATALKVYHQYQERLKFLNSVDFGDLLLYNIQLFNQDTETLFYYQGKFKYIMVDEYQDTNAIQYLWLKYLAREHSNICCVGDDDQSIYSWRGAEVENILKFSDDFEGARTVKLECNYRSTSHILATASHVINHNKTRLEKKLWTTNIKGEKVNLIKLRDGKTEARFISEQVLKFNKYKFSDIAVLVRATFQTRVLEEYFVKYSIPYKIVSGVKFYERQEVRDIIAYLRLVINNNDDLAFERIVNRPKRSLGPTTMKKIYAAAQNNKVSLFEAAKTLVDSNQVAEKTKLSLNGFLNKIKAWEKVVSVKSLNELVKTIANQSGYIEMLENEGVTGLARMENVRELISSLKSFHSATTFLEHISLMMEVDNINNDNTVYVMTLHAAKGLEFPCVFLPGWEEGLFPHQRSFEDSSGKALEEERRLAYVGITRAKEKLIISCADRREVNNQWQPMYVSRFVKELPRENVKVIRNYTVYC